MTKSLSFAPARTVKRVARPAGGPLGAVDRAINSGTGKAVLNGAGMIPGPIGETSCRLTRLAFLEYRHLSPPPNERFFSLFIPGGVAHGIKAVDELAHSQFPAAATDAILAVRNFL